MQKKYFIFRNSTVEPFFMDLNASFSGYNDISIIPDDADCYFWFYLPPIKTNADLLASEIEGYMQQLLFVLSLLNPNKTCYAFTIYQSYYVYNETGNRVITNAIEDYNKKLYELSQNAPNLKVIDFSHFCRRYSASNLINWKYYYISQMQLNPLLRNDFHQWLQLELAAIEGRRKKCLVLDLDNTLWGGILGEDGIEGIQIGNTYPGNAFLDFQKNLLELSEKGVILTVCSKNNEQDVLEAWDKIPFLPIRKEQLAAWRINWNNKADSISELVQELNIGLDSLVLIDDNPSERTLVKQFHPMVETPEFPQQPYLLPAFFEKICEDYFLIYKLTDEDTTKLAQYQANIQRNQAKKSFASFDDYLKSLEIELHIQDLNRQNAPRIAQLTQKTNQFNLTTKRYTEEDLQTLANHGAKIYCLRVKDRFGDNGITGVAIITFSKNGETAEIDSFLLSCRILGKQIENIILKYILLQIEDFDYQYIKATFIPSSKNSQVADFFDLNGFILTGTDNRGVKKYSCRVDELDKTIPDFYKIYDHDR